MDRRELVAMSDSMLQIKFDGLMSRLHHDWERGCPGRMQDVVSMTLIHIEAVSRGISMLGPPLPGQLRLDVGSSALRRVSGGEGSTPQA